MNEIAPTSSTRRKRSIILVVFATVVSIVGVWQYTMSGNNLETTFHPHLGRFNDTIQANITRTRLTTTPPYFDFLRYQKGEKDMMLRDYALFHSYVLKGELPPRYFVMDTHTGVGFGNRHKASKPHSHIDSSKSNLPFSSPYYRAELLCLNGSVHTTSISSWMTRMSIFIG